MSGAEGFATSFERAAAPVRRWLALRAALTGVGAGLVAGAVATGLSWHLRRGELRPFALAAFAVVGAVIALAIHRRRALTDREMALYLDRRLGTNEVISTAMDIEKEGAAAGVVVSRATDALRDVDTRRTRPRVLRRLHALAVLGVGAGVAFAVLPLPPAPPAPPPAPGTELVTLDDVPGIDRLIEQIGATKARDAEQQERLDALEERAKDLRDKLEHGAPRREVQSELAEIAKALAAERMDVGRGDGRRGLEAALDEMNDPQMREARRALADRDLSKLGDELDRLSRKDDEKQRDAAKKALEDAAKAAREAGAEDVAKMLEEERKRFEEGEKKAEDLRNLEKALGGTMPESSKDALERMNEGGDAAAQKELLDAAKKAFDKLSEEEKKKLAEKLAKGQDASGKELSEADKKALEELAKQLSTKEGQEALERTLKELANAPPPTSEAERQQQLEKAEGTVGEMKNGLGKGEGKPGSGPGASGTAVASGDAAGGGNGPSPKKTASPPTGKVSAGTVTGKATGKIGSATPLPDSTVVRADARSGETANRKGTGALGTVGPAEVGGVSRSDVPEEYREQVGRYFEP